MTIKNITNLIRKELIKMKFTENGKLNQSIITIETNTIYINRDCILKSDKIKELKLKTKYIRNIVKYDKFVLDKFTDEYLLCNDITNVYFLYTTKNNKLWVSKYIWVKNLGEWKFIQNMKMY